MSPKSMQQYRDEEENIENTVMIAREEYYDLLRDSFFLNALRNAGVDNWDGYEYAQDELNNYDEE